MSFFDLENELPGCLDAAIATHTGFSEIQNQAVINKLDTASQDSYHLICADKGSMATNGNMDHHIWKFQAPQGNMRAYGKYLEYSGNNTTIQFWIGLVVKDKTITFYLWFGVCPPASIRQCLLSLLDEERDKCGHWYKEKQGNVPQVSDMLTECCGCGSAALNKEALDTLKQKIKTVIDNLLKAVEKAV
jgi:hypothetical protein